MNKILICTLLVTMAASCHKMPYPIDSDKEYLVYTSPGDEIKFAEYKTFALADSVLIVGKGNLPEYSQSVTAMSLLEQVRTNMEKSGYVHVDSPSIADVGIQITYIIKTERFLKYYDDPYWWLNLAGYWPSGYWGNWQEFFYPYPISYTYTTNALIIDMVDLTGEERDSEPLEVVWTSYIGGPVGYSLKSDIERMKSSIDQAFLQSPYLKKTASGR